MPLSLRMSLLISCLCGMQTTENFTDIPFTLLLQVERHCFNTSSALKTQQKTQGSCDSYHQFRKLHGPQVQRGKTGTRNVQHGIWHMTVFRSYQIHKYNARTCMKSLHVHSQPSTDLPITITYLDLSH